MPASFQTDWNDTIAIVAMAGLIKGKIMDQKTLNWLAPSILAASIKSFGI